MAKVTTSADRSHIPKPSPRADLKSVGHLLVLIFIGVILPFVLRSTSTKLSGKPDFLLLELHAASEGFGAILAVIFGVLILTELRFRNNDYYRIWLSMGLFSMAIFDGCHSVIPPGNLFVWFHSLATFFGGLLFSFVWIPLPIPKKALKLPVLIGGAVILCVVLFSLICTDSVPPMLSSGGFTSAATILNASGGGLFIVSLPFFILKYRKSHSTAELLFCYMTALFGLSSLLFDASELWSPFWWYWHLIRLLAYLIAFSYIIREFIHVRLSLSSSNEKHERANIRLAAAMKELKSTNVDLAARNEELDEFTYVASHDLQEPLRKLVAFSGLLRRDLPGEMPERAETDLHYIETSARRMQTLVSDLLHLSRAGRKDASMRSLDLSECIENAVANLSSRIEETGATIEFRECPRVVGDPVMLTQLYQNLISNALKFRSATTPLIHLTFEERPPGMVFGVTDNGIGIQPEYAKQIFTAFKRLHSSAEYDGTGIGLAICKKIVERHGGSIWVESQPGNGSRFLFTLAENVMEEST